MIRRLVVLAACLVLAEQQIAVTVTSQQRVARRTVIQWCTGPASQAWLERRTVMVVDGKDAGAPETERLYDLKGDEVTWRLTQGGF